jgi:transposase
VLDPSGTYRKTVDDTRANIVQVADPFHLVKLTNSKLDECRRRVQDETIGHRGRKDGPLYRARRLLTKARERLDERGDTKLPGLLEAGDPHREARTAWYAKNVVHSVYDITDPELAGRVRRPARRRSAGPVVPRPRSACWAGPSRWCDQIVAWYQAFASNGPTEAVNNLIKPIKRIGFGFRRFAHYRIRVLLYASKPTRSYSRPSLPAEIQ